MWRREGSTADGACRHEGLMPTEGTVCSRKGLHRRVKPY